MLHVLIEEGTKLLLLSCPAFFWTLTYILVIRRSFLDQTYGVPLIAICTNISWEFIFSFVRPAGGITGFEYTVWFSLDVIIFFTLLKYGPREFANLSKVVFYAMVGVVLMAAFCTVLFMSYVFDPTGTDPTGTYSGFIAALIMSVLFIVMLYSRKSLRGQSLSIAGCKILGNGMASLATYLYFSEYSLLLLFLFVAIFIFDLIYLVMVQAWTFKPGPV